MRQIHKHSYIANFIARLLVAIMIAAKYVFLIMVSKPSYKILYIFYVHYYFWSNKQYCNCHHHSLSCDQISNNRYHLFSSNTELILLSFVVNIQQKQLKRIQLITVSGFVIYAACHSPPLGGTSLTLSPPSGQIMADKYDPCSDSEIL